MYIMTIPNFCCRLKKEVIPMGQKISCPFSPQLKN